MNIYEMALNAAKEGKKVTVDLKEKTLKVGKVVLIEKGVAKKDSLLIDLDIATSPWEDVEILYANYKRSMPSAKEINSYFTAVSVDELSLEEMVHGEKRGVARVRLEAYILCAALAGFLKWKNEKHWFWKGPDEDLVVLKEWVTV